MGSTKKGQCMCGTKAVAVDKSRDVSSGVCVCVCGASGPPYPRGLEQLIQSADTLLRNHARY